MYKSILVPIDLAHVERAKPMFDQAKELCAPDGKVIAAHIVPVIPSYVSAELPGDFFQKGERTARAELEKLVKDSGLEVQTIVRSGSPASACLAIAEETGSDLIIVASHNPGLADYFLGSTAARIVRHAECSVLVMR